MFVLSVDSASFLCGPNNYAILLIFIKSIFFFNKIMVRYIIISSFYKINNKI